MANIDSFVIISCHLFAYAFASFCCHRPPFPPTFCWCCFAAVLCSATLCRWLDLIDVMLLWLFKCMINQHSIRYTHTHTHSHSLHIERYNELIFITIHLRLLYNKCMCVWKCDTDVENSFVMYLSCSLLYTWADICNAYTTYTQNRYQINMCVACACVAMLLCTIFHVWSHTYRDIYHQFHCMYVCCCLLFCSRFSLRCS